MKVVDADVEDRAVRDGARGRWIDGCDRLLVTWSAGSRTTVVRDGASGEPLAEIRRNDKVVAADREGLSGMPVTWAVSPLQDDVEAPMLQRAPDLFGNRMEALGPHGRTIASVVWRPRFLTRCHLIFCGRDRANRLTVRGRPMRHWRLSVSDGSNHTIGTIGRLRPSGKRISRRRRKIPRGMFDDLERVEIAVKRGRLTPALRWGLIAWTVLVTRTGDDSAGTLGWLAGR